VKNLAGSTELGGVLLADIDNVVRRTGGKLLCDAGLQFALDFVLDVCLPRKFDRTIGDETDVLLSLSPWWSTNECRGSANGGRGTAERAS
jgi:hypothetical protein